MVAWGTSVILSITHRPPKLNFRNRPSITSYRGSENGSKHFLGLRAVGRNQKPSPGHAPTQGFVQEKGIAWPFYIFICSLQKHVHKHIYIYTHMSIYVKMYIKIHIWTCVFLFLLTKMDTSCVTCSYAAHVRRPPRSTWSWARFGHCKTHAAGTSEAKPREDGWLSSVGAKELKLSCYSLVYPPILATENKFLKGFESTK